MEKYTGMYKFLETLEAAVESGSFEGSSKFGSELLQGLQDSLSKRGNAAIDAKAKEIGGEVQKIVSSAVEQNQVKFLKTIVTEINSALQNQMGGASSQQLNTMIQEGFRSVFSGITERSIGELVRNAGPKANLGALKKYLTSLGAGTEGIKNLPQFRQIPQSTIEKIVNNNLKSSKIEESGFAEVNKAYSQAVRQVLEQTYKTEAQARASIMQRAVQEIGETTKRVQRNPKFITNLGKIDKEISQRLRAETKVKRQTTERAFNAPQEEAEFARITGELDSLGYGISGYKFDPTTGALTFDVVQKGAVNKARGGQTVKLRLGVGKGATVGVEGYSPVLNMTTVGMGAKYNKDGRFASYAPVVGSVQRDLFTSVANALQRAKDKAIEERGSSKSAYTPADLQRVLDRTIRNFMDDQIIAKREDPNDGSVPRVTSPLEQMSKSTNISLRSASQSFIRRYNEIKPTLRRYDGGTGDVVSEAQLYELFSVLMANPKMGKEDLSKMNPVYATMLSSSKGENIFNDIVKTADYLRKHGIALANQNVNESSITKGLFGVRGQNITPTAGANPFYSRNQATSILEALDRKKKAKFTRRGVFTTPLADMMGVQFGQPGGVDATAATIVTNDAVLKKAIAAYNQIHPDAQVSEFLSVHDGASLIGRSYADSLTGVGDKDVEVSLPEIFKYITRKKGGLITRLKKKGLISSEQKQWLLNIKNGVTPFKDFDFEALGESAQEFILNGMYREILGRSGYETGGLNWGERVINGETGDAYYRLTGKARYSASSGKRLVDFFRKTRSAVQVVPDGFIEMVAQMAGVSPEIMSKLPLHAVSGGGFTGKIRKIGDFLGGLFPLVVNGLMDSEGASSPKDVRDLFIGKIQAKAKELGYDTEAYSKIGQYIRTGENGLLDIEDLSNVFLRSNESRFKEMSVILDHLAAETYGYAPVYDKSGNAVNPQTAFQLGMVNMGVRGTNTYGNKNNSARMKDIIPSVSTAVALEESAGGIDRGEAEELQTYFKKRFGVPEANENALANLQREWTEAVQRSGASRQYTETSPSDISIGYGDGYTIDLYTLERETGAELNPNGLIRRVQGKIAEMGIKDPNVYVSMPEGFEMKDKIGDKSYEFSGDKLFLPNSMFTEGKENRSFVPELYQVFRSIPRTNPTEDGSVGDVIDLNRAVREYIKAGENTFYHKDGAYYREFLNPKTRYSLMNKALPMNVNSGYQEGEEYLSWEGLTPEEKLADLKKRIVNSGVLMDTNTGRRQVTQLTDEVLNSYLQKSGLTTEELSGMKLKDRRNYVTKMLTFGTPEMLRYLQGVTRYEDLEGLYQVLGRTPYMGMEDAALTNKVFFDALLGDENSIRLGTGLALRMNADFDGDNITGANIFDTRTPALKKLFDGFERQIALLSRTATAGALADLQDPTGVSNIRYNSMLEQQLTPGVLIGRDIIGAASNARLRLSEFLENKKYGGASFDSVTGAAQFLMRQLMEALMGAPEQGVISSKKLADKDIKNPEQVLSTIATATSDFVNGMRTQEGLSIDGIYNLLHALGAVKDTNSPLTAGRFSATWSQIQGAIQHVVGEDPTKQQQFANMLGVASYEDLVKNLSQGIIPREALTAAWGSIARETGVPNFLSTLNLNQYAKQKSVMTDAKALIRYGQKRQGLPESTGGANRGEGMTTSSPELSIENISREHRGGYELIPSIPGFGDGYFAGGNGHGGGGSSSSQNLGVVNLGKETLNLLTQVISKAVSNPQRRIDKFAATADGARVTTAIGPYKSLKNGFYLSGEEYMSAITDKLLRDPRLQDKYFATGSAFSSDKERARAYGFQSTKEFKKYAMVPGTSTGTLAHSIFELLMKANVKSSDIPNLLKLLKSGGSEQLFNKLGQLSSDSDYQDKLSLVKGNYQDYLRSLDLLGITKKGSGVLPLDAGLNTYRRAFEDFIGGNINISRHAEVPLYPNREMLNFPIHGTTDAILFSPRDAGRGVARSHQTLHDTKVYDGKGFNFGMIAQLANYYNLEHILYDEFKRYATGGDQQKMASFDFGLMPKDERAKLLSEWIQSRKGAPSIAGNELSATDANTIFTSISDILAQRGDISGQIALYNKQDGGTYLAKVALENLRNSIYWDDLINDVLPESATQEIMSQFVSTGNNAPPQTFANNTTRSAGKKNKSTRSSKKGLKLDDKVKEYLKIYKTYADLQKQQGEMIALLDKNVYGGASEEEVQYIQSRIDDLGLLINQQRSTLVSAEKKLPAYLREGSSVEPGPKQQLRKQDFESKKAGIDSTANFAVGKKEQTALNTAKAEYIKLLNQELEIRKKLAKVEHEERLLGKTTDSTKALTGSLRAQLGLLQQQKATLDKSGAGKIQEVQQAAQMNTLRLQEYVAGFNGKSGGATGPFSNFFANIKASFGSVINYGLAMKFAYAIPQTLTKIITLTKELDAAMMNIRVVTGYNQQEATKLMFSYQQLGETLGATTQEIANAANEWLRQGYNASEAGKLIEASTKLSKLGMIDASEATKYLTSSLKGFKLEAESAISIVDKLTKVDMAAAVSAGEIAEAMSRTATSAQLAGLDMDKTIGILATIGEVTQKSMSSVGESMKTLLSRYGNVKAGVFADMGLTEDSETTENINDIEKVLGKLGIRIRSSSLEMRNIGDVLDELATKWQTLDVVSKNAVATAFAGVRQRENFNVLMENYTRAQELTAESANSRGTSDQKYDAYLDSIEASIKKVQNAWEKLTQSIKASPVIKMGAEGLAWTIRNLSKILSLITAITTYIQGKKIINSLKDFGDGSVLKGIGHHLWNLGSRAIGKGKKFDVATQKTEAIEAGNGAQDAQQQTVQAATQNAQAIQQNTQAGQGSAQSIAQSSPVDGVVEGGISTVEGGGATQGKAPLRQRLKSGLKTWWGGLGTRALQGAGVGAVSGLMAAMSTGEVKRGDVSLEATAADKAVVGGTTLGLTALGGAIAGPIGMMIGSTVGPIIGDALNRVIRKDDLDRKERVQQAEKQLEAIRQTNSILSDMKTIGGSEGALTSDEYSRMREYVEQAEETLSSSLDLQKQFNSIIGGSESFITNLRNLYSDEVSVRKQAMSALEKVLLEEEKKQYIASQEEALYERGNKTSTELYQEVAALKARRSQATNEKDRSELSEQINDLQKQYVDQLAYERKIRQYDVQIGYQKTNISQWSRTDLEKMGFEGLVDMIASQTDGARYGGTGAINLQYKQMIEDMIKSDPELSFLLRGGNLTLNEMNRAGSSMQEALSQLGIARSELGDAIANNTTKVQEFANALGLTEEALRGLYYSSDPSKIEELAYAFGMTAEKLQQIKDIVGDISLSDSFLSPSDVRAKTDDYLSIYQDMVTNGVLSQESLEKVLDNEELLKYMKNPEELQKFLQENLFNDGKLSYASFLYQNSIMDSLNSNSGFFTQFLEGREFTDDVDKQIYNVIQNSMNFDDAMKAVAESNLSSDAKKRWEEMLNEYYDLDIQYRMEDPALAAALEYQNHLLDERLKNLNEQKEGLSKVNEESKRQLEYTKAQIALENASKEQKRVYREGVGWTWETDTAAVKEAQDKLEQLDVQKQEDTIQYEIDKLNAEKELLENIPKQEEIEGLKTTYEAWAEKVGASTESLGSVTVALAELYTKIQSFNPSKPQGGEGSGGSSGGGSMIGNNNEAEQGAADAKEEDKKKAQAEADRIMGEMRKLFFDANSGDYVGYKQNINQYNQYLDQLQQLEAGGAVLDEYGKNAITMGHKEATDQAQVTWTFVGPYDVADTRRSPEEFDREGIVNFTSTVPDSRFGKYDTFWVYTPKHGWEKLEKNKLASKQTSNSDYYHNVVVPYDQEAPWHNPTGVGPTAPPFFAYYKNGQFYKLQFVNGSGKNTNLGTYAKGTFSTPATQPTLINELGTEALVTPSGTLTALPAKTGVVPADITKNLWELGEIAPSLKGLLTPSLRGVLGGNSFRDMINNDGMFIDKMNITVYPTKDYDMDKFLREAKNIARSTRYKS